MADRYVFSIHSNTKWGVDLGVSFFTCFFASEAAAIAVLNEVNTFLPNYAKCSLSKVLREASGYEIPDSGAQLTDINVVSFALANDQNSAIRRTIKIPLPFIQDGPSQVTTGLEQVAGILMQNATDEAGNLLNTLLGYSFAPKNIVTGGPVNRVATAVQRMQQNGEK